MSSTSRFILPRLYAAPPAFKGTMAEAATKHSEAVIRCRNASHFAYEESNKFRAFALQHRLGEKYHTKKADTAYLEAKFLKSKSKFQFPEKEPHLTLACNCTTYEGCQTARDNAWLREGASLEALARDDEHRRERISHLRYAAYHGGWASSYKTNRANKVSYSLKSHQNCESP